MFEDLQFVPRTLDGVDQYALADFEANVTHNIPMVEQKGGMTRLGLCLILLCGKKGSSWLGCQARGSFGEAVKTVATRRER